MKLFSDDHRPVHPEQFKMRTKRIVEHARSSPIMLGVPPLFAFECRLVLLAYYGSRWKLILAMLKEILIYDQRRHYWHFVLWFADRMKWTRLQAVPGCDPKKLKIRHGAKCQYHNCDDINCISKSMPRWYRWITRFDKR